MVLYVTCLEIVEVEYQYCFIYLAASHMIFQEGNVTIDAACDACLIGIGLTAKAYAAALTAATPEELALCLPLCG